MATPFEIVTEEFVDDMEAIRSLVETFNDPQKAAKARIAAANSATLLLAATFEEYIREMAREYARTVVSATESFDKLPHKLAATAWKRTMDGLSRVRFDGSQIGGGQENIFGIAQAKFNVIHDFCKGDLTQDIYRDLIHNENNMRPTEINGLFKVSGLGDACKKISDKPTILEIFGDADPAKAHGKLLIHLEQFFERRNAIAHALNPGQSSGPDQIINDLNLLISFGVALCETLTELSPAPAAEESENQSTGS